MPTNQMKPVTAWSYSRLSVFRKCPRQFMYKFVQKLPEPKAPAMERGSRIHDALQAYIEGKAKKLPEDDATNYGTLKPIYAALRKAKATCELEYAMDVKWSPSPWMAWDVTWVRAKLDAELWLPKSKLVEVYDHKTGKVRPEEHAEQLEIYALAAFAHRPDAKEVKASMLYVDAGQRSDALFEDREKTMKRLKKKWEAEVKPMMKDKTFKATPSRECNWCPYSGSRKGGPCDKG